MSNGGPAMERDARQDAGVRTPRQPTTVGLAHVHAYLDPRRETARYVAAPGSDGIAIARLSAIEDARVDCRSTILRNAAIPLR